MPSSAGGSSSISWRIQAVHQEAESNTQSEERCAMRPTREAAKPSKEAAFGVCMYATRRDSEPGGRREMTGQRGVMKGSDG